MKHDVLRLLIVVYNKYKIVYIITQLGKKCYLDWLKPQWIESHINQLFW